ncbi:YezD family protein [Sandaracinobacteroides hominis]|uniref:YezD family protein n=1 Tax=Sandaracinobacteroides hominis TaxID=2780086 RepID=UPI0018F541FD|nr:YezD family protein [Sandaracinobacteroides hominis]
MSALGHDRPVHLPVQPTEAALAIVAEALGRVRFGDIRLTVHEGRLVQIDVTEKTRLPQS